MTDIRYNRQQLIPDWNQQKLKKSSVLILGVGATGSYVATNLVQSGVGKVILVDYDSIEMSNLNRQLLFRPQDVGQNKAEIAAQKLMEINPEVKIEFYPHKMQKIPKSMLKDISLIACCLDTFPGRRWANSLAISLKIPMINGGMYAFLGDVQTIIPYESACFECQPLISQEKLSQACTPLGTERKNQELDKEEAKLPSVSTLSSIIGGLMAQEILKLLIDVGEILDNYLFYDGLHNSFTQLKLSRNENCPLCGSANQLQKMQALVMQGERVIEFKNRVALAFGMAKPELMTKGKFLQDSDLINCQDGDKIYAIDERLAAPITLIVTIFRED